MVIEADQSGSGESLETAYRQALYLVQLETDGLPFHIGRPSTTLRYLLQSHGVTSACFATAANPGSRLQADRVNARAQADLVAEVEQMGFAWIPGVSRDPAGEWPDEASVLVLGADEPAARQLGGRFGQNAVVLINDTGLPTLLWLERETGLP